MDLKSFCHDEIHRLTRINPEEVLSPANELNSSGILIDELKAMLKKGERVNLKLIQELSDKIEAFGNRMEASFQYSESEEELKNGTKQFISLVHLALDQFDFLDYLRQLEGNYSEKWIGSLNQAVRLALQKLKAFGIEEIHALGETFDPYVMEGISTSPLEEHDNKSKFEVISVVQRGFQFASDRQLIRKAKVITLL